ncbi:MAG TPA: hypothetical protein VMU29_05925 [Smithella sp.]|nr:hypothetical protein [Smithella sp.]
MKPLRVFSIISSFVMISSLLFFTFSGISIASETQGTTLGDCLSSCKNKGDVCINMTADSRRCTAVYQECVDACKKASDSSSSNSSDSNSSSSQPSGGHSSSSTLK